MMMVVAITVLKADLGYASLFARAARSGHDVDNDCAIPVENGQVLCPSSVKRAGIDTSYKFCVTVSQGCRKPMCPLILHITNCKS